MRRHAAILLTAAACLGAALAVPAAAEPAGKPLKPLDELDAAFTAAAAQLARTAEADGHADLARLITGWQLPAAGDTQLVVAIPPRLERPDVVDMAAEEAIWNDFVAARRARAAGLFDHAVAAARAHDRTATREELARPDADATPLPQRSCEAIRLLHLTLRDDPDHERARSAGGWVRRGEAWLWPEAARRLDKGEEFDPAFGWMPKAKLARYRSGERQDRGRWVTAADDDQHARDVKHGREFVSDHWEIVSAAGLADAAALAARLEEARTVWQQVFGAFADEPKDLERRLAGRGRATVHTPFSAILCADRGQYVAELERLEPLIAKTNGIYWSPTKTIWFFVDAKADPAEPNPVTVHHEATHQLFAEARHEATKARQMAGERNGFWAIEAAACYLETMRPTDFGWQVGGRDAGRAPAAKERLDDGFYVPLADLSRLGRREFQADERLPQIYSQLGGLADFFMNGAGGRYRESFVEYLVRVYSGTANPDTLERLCGRSFAELDDAYRRHLQR